MRAPLIAFLCCLPAVVAACDGCSSTNGTGESGCQLEDGTVLAVGESGPAPDGCNTCLCTLAEELSCTTSACNDAGPEQPDAGPEPDAGTPDAGVVDEGPCHDEDGDGFYSCIDESFPARPTIVDCDDVRFHVQPGGIEFPETTEDDNCNGDNTDFLTCGCDGVASNVRDLAAGMDLCGDVVAGATKSGGAEQFGIVGAYQTVVEERVRVRIDAPDAPPVVIGNTCLTTLSTGTATGTGTAEGPQTCDHADPDPEGGGISSGTICDLAQIRLTLRAPPNAQGFAFDFMFLSYEWPEFLCQVYNDTFYALVQTDAVFEGAETNAAFDTAGRPITVNVGFFENPAEWTVPLDGTSQAEDAFGSCSFPTEDGCVLPEYCNDGTLDARSGSGSGWLTTTVPIRPGEQDVQLVLSIHDESDSAFDSIVLLDSFRWLNLPTELETSKEQR
jgi:hypothetical protein